MSWKLCLPMWYESSSISQILLKGISLDMSMRYTAIVYLLFSSVCVFFIARCNRFFWHVSAMHFVFQFKAFFFFDKCFNSKLLIYFNWRYDIWYLLKDELSISPNCMFEFVVTCSMIENHYESNMPDHNHKYIIIYTSWRN